MILALELRPNRVVGHALDEAGVVQYARVRALSQALSSANRWLEMVELARDLCAGVALEAAQMSRIALVFPAALDETGRVQSGIEGFGGYDLQRGLREHLQSETAQLVVASASVADAWAQHNAGVLRGFDNWVYLGLDEQLESVACARGVWLRADLGGLILERDGAMDSAGRQGTLSAYCAGQSFAERARSYSLNVEASQIWGALRIEFRRALAGRRLRFAFGAGPGERGRGA